MENLPNFLLSADKINAIQESLIENRKLILMNEQSKSNLFFSFSCFVFLYSISIYLYFNNFVLVGNTYFLIGGWAIEIILTTLSYAYQENYVMVNKLKYCRFFSFYLTNAITLIFPVNYPQQNNYNFLRQLYSFIIIINLSYTYYLDFNVIFLVIFAILNSILLIYLQYTFNLPCYFLAPEFIGNIIYYLGNFIMSDSDNSSEKIEKLIKLTDNKDNFENIKELMYILNSNVISVNIDNKVIFVNNFGFHYFEKRIELEDLKQIEKGSINNKSNEDKSSKILNYISLFIKSLILKESESSFIEGKSLLMIVFEILSKNLAIKNFTMIGKFKIQNEGCFEILLRTQKFTEKVVEIIINDLMEMNEEGKENRKISSSPQKLEEESSKELLIKEERNENRKIPSQQKLEEEIFANKSLPLNENTTKPKLILTDDKRGYLKPLKNLSNNTIFLIRDIFQFVSGFKEFNISSNDMEIKKIFGFCYNFIKKLFKSDKKKLQTIKL